MMTAHKIGRNDSCPCGSEKKFKHCCERKKTTMSKVAVVAIVGLVVAMVAIFVYSFQTSSTSSGMRQVWDPVHGHYHNVP